MIYIDLNSDKNETTKQTKSKEKKQNFKPVKTKETALKHPWLCASLKGSLFRKKELKLKYFHYLII